MKTGSLKLNGNIIYFSHGGGPLPILGDPGHAKMITFMKQLPENLKKPDAVIVISAHWEENIPTIIGTKSPPLLYDYYGFPEEAYNIEYPVPGNPELAETVKQLLETNGIQSKITGERGFDHGLFIPLKMMWPVPEIPMIQISLIHGLDPEKHILLGNALQSLREEKILTIGSGFSFHNMGAFTYDNSNNPDFKNDEFQEWLIDVCTGNYTTFEREQRLIKWDKAPYARYCHPREEHLLPLHVCIGMSEEPANLIFDDYILGKRSIGLQW